MMRLGVTLFCLLVTFSATVGAQEQRLQQDKFFLSFADQDAGCLVDRKR